MNFDFISDTRFKDLLQRDFKEMKSCFENKSSKAVLVLAGSIIEACLIEYFIQNPSKLLDESKLLKMTLNDLIDLSQKEGLLSDTEKNLASVIQDYRNLIHPGRQVRKNANYDFDTASIAFTLVTIILKAIGNKQQALNFFKAQDVIDKLKSDWNFRAICERVILKLNEGEKNKLFNLLLDFECEEKRQWMAFSTGDSNEYETHDLYYAKEIISHLKPLLQPQFVKDKLNELIHHIEKGSNLNAFALFNFLHEDLDKLPDNDQEMIAIYLLSTFSNCLENCLDISHEKTYSTIGKYIKTKKGINEFKNFSGFCLVNFGGDGLKAEMDVFEQIFNSLQEPHRNELVDDLKERIRKANGAAPIFESEVIKRKII
jgi:hypothetical protein